MGRTLFFDLATITGYAVGSVARVEESGTIAFPRTGDDHGALLLSLLATFGKLLDRVKPDDVGYESPILPRRTQIHILRKLYLMGPALEAACIRRKVPVFEGAIGDIRAHFLGHGNIPRGSERQKIAIKNRCRERGWKFRDDNEADALAGLDWALACDDPAFALAGAPLFTAAT